MSTTVGTNTFSDIPDVNGVSFLLNDGGTPSILSDIISNRPSFGKVGRLFVDTTNNIIYRDTGTSWVDLYNHISIISKNTTSVGVSPTTETNIINFTVPGGTLGTDKVMIVNAAGMFMHSTATITTTIRIRILYGGIVLYDDTSAAFASGVTFPFNIILTLSPQNSLTLQRLSGVFLGGASTAATTGFGDLGAGTIRINTPFSGSSAVTSNIDQTFTVAVTLRAGTAGLTALSLDNYVAEVN